MFIDVTTAKGEKLSLNLSHIVAIHEYRKGTIIFDSCGIDIEIKESYEEFMKRLCDLVMPCKNK